MRNRVVFDRLERVVSVCSKPPQRWNYRKPFVSDARSSKKGDLKLSPKSDEPKTKRPNLTEDRSLNEHAKWFRNIEIEKTNFIWQTI